MQLVMDCFMGMNVAAMYPSFYGNLMLVFWKILNREKDDTFTGITF